jgi:hypothetical protein
LATARTSAAHQKRVQKIAADAAEKIAADAPLEEEVVVVIEELPPGEPATPGRSRSRGSAQDAASGTMIGMVAQTQKLVAEGIGRWIEMSAAPFNTSGAPTEPFSGLFDARRFTEETFRLAEELLASQRQFALKVVEAMTPANAA